MIIICLLFTVSLMQEAYEVMDEWWAKHKNVVNLLEYMKKKNIESLQRRYTQLSFLDQLCSGNSKDLEKVCSISIQAV